MGQAFVWVPVSTSQSKRSQRQGRVPALGLRGWPAELPTVLASTQLSLAPVLEGCPSEETAPALAALHLTGLDQPGTVPFASSCVPFPRAVCSFRDHSPPSPGANSSALADLLLGPPAALDTLALPASLGPLAVLLHPTWLSSSSCLLFLPVPP